MSTATATPAAPAKARTARKSTKLQGLQVFMENRLAVFGVCMLLILLAFSFIGPLFYVTDQVHTDLMNSASSPALSRPRSAPCTARSRASSGAGSTRS